MGRRPKDQKKSVQYQLEKMHKWCKYCQRNQNSRGFTKHQTSCKKIWVIRNELQANQSSSASRLCAEPEGPYQDNNVDSSNPTHDSEQSNDSRHNILDASDYAQGPGLSPSEACNDQPLTQAEDVVFGPRLPAEYIKIVPHPHSPDPTVKIIPLDNPNSVAASTTSNEPAANLSDVEAAPWAPFQNLPDFEYTESVIMSCMPKKYINKQLAGVSGSWAEGSRITFKSYHDMESVLNRARKRCVQFKTDSVTLQFQGESQTFEFEYRDPWEWMLSLVQDETLAPVAMWNSVQKFYCAGDWEERIYDEPNTANTWWGIDTELPDSDTLPHCYIPIHFWLDKGLVTRRVKMYPMVVRPAWLPREIRNGSGNGGGILIGYMPMVEDPSDPKSRSASETEEYAHFRRELYQKVLAKVFRNLKQRSLYGEAHKCADGITRVLYPGILIESQDAEEAAYFCGCRNSRANYPCPKCLVPHDELSVFSKEFELRTPATMRAVLALAASETTKAAKERILVSYGLHNIEHFLWGFRFSDPYKAYSYDTLHSDDLGKWGKHLWVLLLDQLEKSGNSGHVTRRMALFPRWSGLKHFNSVTTTKFTDGQAFYDILKCILPCIVDVFPSNSALVHCVRAYVCFRISVGYKCMTSRRLTRLKEAIKTYGKRCQDVSAKYGKSFDFLKQHAIIHVCQDICDKGTVDNFSTRVGEGFQQEASQAYKQTNMKNAEHQMCVIDEKQEAVAQIRMRIDDDKRARLNLEENQVITNESDAELALATDLTSQKSGETWKLGSPEGRRTNLRLLAASHSPQDSCYKSLHERVRDFVIFHFPEEALHMSDDDDIPVQQFKCVALKYQSIEDWGSASNIIRCNTNFHGRERFDCIILHDDAPRSSVARLRALLRCWLPSGRTLDIALIHRFSNSKKRAKTMWEGCRILDEDKDSTLIQVEYFVRGALLCPMTMKQDERSYYLIDTIDADMFLRENGR